MKSLIKLFMIFIWGLLLAGCVIRNGDKYFTGQITYLYSYDSEVLDIDSLTKAKPSAGIFKFDLNNYQSIFIGRDSTIYLYSGRLNKTLFKAGRHSNCGCEDYNIPGDPVISFSIYDTDEKVMGYSCSILEFKTKSFLTRYYVSKELKIAPATYQHHKAYNWSFYGKKTGGGLILKLEHHFKNYTMKGIASTIARADKTYNALDIPESEFAALCK